MYTDKQKIPRIIHYCWFGGMSKPKLVRDCIASWKRFMPDYEIIEWNEKNTDLTHHFVEKAYNLKKWAFVADYIRLDVLNKKGGIYLDTDMMVLKSFDNLLDSYCFFGAEDFFHINAAIIGTIPKNEFIRECLQMYDGLDLNAGSHLGEITIPKMITAKYNGLSQNAQYFNKIISCHDIVIYPPEYFYPFPFENKKDLKNYKNYIHTESYTVHLWHSSWIEFSEFHYFRNSEYSLGFRKVFNKIIKEKRIDLKYIRKIASAIKESLNKRR
ncbi:glycosyltransferase [Flavobacterium poyangense]|uniref:glycosyltransferase n=1 Tax=Flavobacterium poyangense TaxID=2204302 RepID=UPI00141F810A|nr:glycosyltransferase [Flavobacterium sp. JXAS1]